MLGDLPLLFKMNFKNFFIQQRQNKNKTNFFLQGGYEAFPHGSTESLQWQYSGGLSQPHLNSPVPNIKNQKSTTALGLHRRSFYENAGL